MLFCRSLLRAAAMAATLSGSRIRSATSTPAKAGGAPIIAVTTSTTSENFFASSTTASRETSSSAMLSASIRLDRGASPPHHLCAADEIIAVPDGLGIEKHAVEHERDDADKAELCRRIDRPRRRQRIVGHDQRDGRQHEQHAEIEVRARDLEILLAVAQAADEDAEPDEAVTHDHHHRKHGVARQRRLRLVAEHDGGDQRDLDDGDRERQQQRAVGLADSLGDHLGMMHRCEHGAEQDGQQHGREQPSRRPTA